MWQTIPHPFCVLLFLIIYNKRYSPYSFSALFFFIITIKLPSSSREKARGILDTLNSNQSGCWLKHRCCFLEIVYPCRECCVLFTAICTEWQAGAVWPVCVCVCVCVCMWICRGVCVKCLCVCVSAKVCVTRQWQWQQKHQQWDTNGKCYVIGTCGQNKRTPFSTTVAECSQSLGCVCLCNGSLALRGPSLLNSPHWNITSAWARRHTLTHTHTLTLEHVHTHTPINTPIHSHTRTYTPI